MGSKQTKIEGSYLSEITQPNGDTSTVDELQPGLSMATQDAGCVHAFDELDPRSPSGYRTPISVLRKRPTQQQKQQSGQQSENAFSMIRKRFLRINLLDPRSPSTHLNRTPLFFEDANERTFNLDDTFADLFVDSRVPNQEIPTLECKAEEFTAHTVQVDNTVQVDEAIEATCLESMTSVVNDSVETNSFVSAHEEEAKDYPAKLNQTPVELQQLDPRSPTIGVDRTPIIFSDDDEINEDAILENVLATLSLNISNCSSVASLNMASTPVSNADAKKSCNNEIVESNNKRLSNKPLERVRRQHGCQVQRKIKKQSKLEQQQNQKIYEDSENAEPTSLAGSTPTKRSLNSDRGLSSQKRTPLSCVKNRAHLRSRSVESKDKTGKLRLALSSFDDSFNHIQNIKSSSDHVGVKQSGFDTSLEA